MEFKDYYRILGVPRQANDKEIRTAYRRLTRQYHPDVNPDDPEAARRFKDVNEAHHVLSDPERRAYYDRFGADWKQAASTGQDPRSTTRRYGTSPRGFERSGTGGVDLGDLGDFSDFFKTFIPTLDGSANKSI